MFESIRKHQRVLQFLLLILIFPAFVFFGVSGYDRFLSDGDSVATVHGVKIPRQQFDQAMRDQLDRMRETLGGQIDPKLLDTPQARAEVLNGLIAQQLLLDAAIQYRISITDTQLRETILEIPGLRKADGSFDMERYRTLLSAQGMSEAGFESRLRRDLATQALSEAASQSAIVPNALLDRLIALQEQVREVRELVFSPKQQLDKVKSDDAQMRKFYDDNAALFETPESARIDYLVLGVKELEASVVLSADDVRTYYEQNKTRYTTPEERRASHILIAVDPSASADDKAAARKKADELLGLLRGGAEFAALAKANSQDPGSAVKGGDLGFFQRDTMVKSFADAAFALKEGELSEVIESDFGLHLIKLTGIKLGAIKPFEQARPTIEAELRMQQASKKFAESAEAFSNTVYEQSDSLKPAAERFGLKIVTADVPRSGAGLGPESPLANRKLLEALFSQDSIASRRNTDAIEIGGNTLISARIVEHRPAQRKEFAQVRDEVRERILADESRKLAAAAGAARLAELLKAPAELGFSETQKVSRVAPGKLPGAALDAMFKASVDKLPAFVGVDLGASGYAIYRIDTVIDPKPEEIAKRREAFGTQVQSLLGQEQAASVLGSLRNKAKITTRLQALSTEPQQNP
jgi:peptidyl-prolyl cis-trans isomerase D